MTYWLCWQCQTRSIPPSPKPGAAAGASAAAAQLAGSPGHREEMPGRGWAQCRTQGCLWQAGNCLAAVESSASFPALAPSRNWWGEPEQDGLSCSMTMLARQVEGLDQASSKLAIQGSAALPASCHTEQLGGRTPRGCATPAGHGCCCRPSPAGVWVARGVSRSWRCARSQG